MDHLDVGFDVPARVGMDEAEVETPALILDLDALERNIRRMGTYAKAHGMRHRVHGKMHKSVDVAKLQIALGGAEGVCCQKVSEAEVFVRGGIEDVLVSNEVRGAQKIDRLARLPKYGARVSCCVDDIANVEDLSAAAVKHGTELTCLVELEVGAGRCGVETPEDAVAIAKAIDAAPGLRFGGLQAYNGSIQHLRHHEERQSAFRDVLARVTAARAALAEQSLECEIVTGAGTGSHRLEATSGVYNELQCGSYAFMDADYGQVRDAAGRRLDDGAWDNALFVLTSVMSTSISGRAILDAGHKSHAIDSGLPVVFGAPDLAVLTCSDEHATVQDPHNRLAIGDRLRLVPGHCDPTCNLHDWYVGIRSGKVETVWPVSARGKVF